MPRIVCIIQARMNSSRLWGKVAMPIAGQPMIVRVVERVRLSKRVDEIVVATTTRKEDGRIVEILAEHFNDVYVERGSEEDVLDRYYQTAKKHHANIVVRITSDNPFVDPTVIDEAIELFLKTPGCEFVSNNIGSHTYPRGLDVEVLSFGTLTRLWKTTKESTDREHVTIHIKRFPDRFTWRLLKNKENLSHYRLTVDEKEDYQLAKELYNILLPNNPDFRMEDIITVLEKNPELANINTRVTHKNPAY